MDEEDLRFLEDWHAELAAIVTPRELADTLIGDDYALSAYRLSLLGLLGDPESAALEGGTTELARLPLALEIEPILIETDLPQIAWVSAGRLRPRTAAKDTTDA
jgi:hypothetical protein